jgi:hypothetical protein
MLQLTVADAAVAWGMLHCLREMLQLLVGVSLLTIWREAAAINGLTGRGTLIFSSG